MVGKWTNEPCSGVDEVVNTFWVLTVISHGEPRRLSLDAISPDLIL